MRQNPRHWSDITIRNIPLPEQGSRKLFDPSLPGFGIRLTPRSRTFIVQYGPDRKVRTIGRYPDISLREARKAALAIIDGPRPKNAPQSTTALLTAYLADCQRRLRPSTVDRYRFALAKHRNNIDHTTTDPNEIKALKAFYTWCVRHGHMDTNPMAMRTAQFNTRDRVMTDDEVVRIMQYSRPPYSNLVHLLLLTGQRRGQFAQFDRSWIDGDTINFPRTIMKSDRAHTIPLTPHIAMLCDLVPMSGWSKMKARMDRHTGVTDWVLHDIRRYYSTTMAKLGTPLHITEQILDHRSTLTGVAAVYNRYTFLPEMRHAQMTYQQHLATLLAARA